VVLSTGDPNADSCDGYPIVYETILRESQTYEHPPIFLKEDSDHVANDEFLSGQVQEWMAISQQVATGSHRRVLEDGIDVWDSSDEDDEKMKPDELTGMYTEGMDPKMGPVKLSQQQVALQKAAFRAPSVEPSEVSESDMRQRLWHLAQRIKFLCPSTIKSWSAGPKRDWRYLGVHQQGT
jgi:hypothetical protein